jgi:hypothetical protein
MLFVWFFAIAAPALITLTNSDDAIAMVNLNEEEPQEKGEKLQFKEKIVRPHPNNLLFLSQFNKKSISDIWLRSKSEHIIEIPIPPPESIS